MKLFGNGSLIAGAIFALGAVSLAPSQAAAFCVVNESAVPVHLHVTSGSVFLRGIWKIRVPSGHQACCPRRHDVCRQPTATVKAYIPGQIAKGKRGPRIKPRVGPFGRIPIAPINPYLDPGTTICEVGVRRGRTVRVFWTRRHRGCEVWSGRRIVGAASIPRARGPVRKHLFVCNRTRVPAIHVTYAAWWDSARKWTSRGWFKIARGRCVKLALPHDYRGANAYVRAMGGGKTWATRVAALCVNPRKIFRLTNAQRRLCPSGYRKVGFVRVPLRPGTNHFSFHPL